MDGDSKIIRCRELPFFGALKPFLFSLTKQMIFMLISLLFITFIFPFNKNGHSLFLHFISFFNYSKPTFVDVLIFFSLTA